MTSSLFACVRAARSLTAVAAASISIACASSKPPTPPAPPVGWASHPAHASIPQSPAQAQAQAEAHGAASPILYPDPRRWWERRPDDVGPPYHEGRLPPHYGGPTFAPPPFAPPDGYYALNPYSPWFVYRPDRLPGDAYDAPPPGYELREPRDRRFLVTGLALFWGCYGLMAVFGGAINANDGEGSALFVPVVGPFILAGQLEHGNGADWRGYRPLLHMNGVLQAVGLGLTVVGIFKSRPHYERVGEADAWPVDVRVGPGGGSVVVPF